MTYQANNRFPERLNLGVTGGPGYSTRVVRTVGGDEYREQLLIEPLRSWNAAHAVRQFKDWGPLQDHFDVACGMAHTWPFKDWSDYIVSSGIGVFAQLTPTTFQMHRRRTSGGINSDRRIQKPRNNSAFAIVGGVVASTDFQTGIVTMTSGTPTSWVGQFDTHCRYGTDKMEGEIVALDPDDEDHFLMAWSSIPIIEVPV